MTPFALNLQAIVDDPDGIDWSPFRPGVRIHRLYGQGREGAAAALLRYDPGAQVPRHRHDGHEHILVLSGAQQDARGRYETGSLVINTPGSEHAVSSPTGCIVLAIWTGPIAIVGERSY